MTTTNYGQQFTESRHTPIDYLTNHPITLPRTTALTRRGQLVRDSPDSLSDETRHLEHVFQKKKTSNPNFIKLNTHRNTEPNETTNNLTPVTTATIPYIKGTSETIARILRPYDIRVAHKPITTLRHVLTNVKDKDQPHDRQGAVYRIKCILGRLVET